MTTIHTAANLSMQQSPDFLAYHRTFQSELASIKDRIRALIKHWPTDGAFKEDILRSILRRHLPESLLIGRGFILNASEPSSEIDILICDKSKPTLFKEGDLVIVTPDAVRAIIEVKTRLEPSQFVPTLTKLAKVRALCSPNRTWCGLFVYEADSQPHQQLLKALQSAHRETGGEVDFVALGPSMMATLSATMPIAGHQFPREWLTARTSELATSYFLGSPLHTVAGVSSWQHGQAWFPTDDEGDAMWRIGQYEGEPTRVASS